MVRTLQRSLVEAFQGYSYSYSHYNAELECPETKYMEVPLINNVFEVPLLALQTFFESINSENGSTPDAIVVMLNTIGKVPYYKTLDRNMRDIIINRFDTDRLATIEIQKEQLPDIYYATLGTIFDDKLDPLAMCSYQVEKTVSDGIFKYKLVRPILRISPTVYTYRLLTMNKFIINKMLPACIEGVFFYPNSRILNSEHISCKDITDTVKIEIDASPFTIHRTDTPSISTTNQQLRQIALDHLDELIQ